MLTCFRVLTLSWIGLGKPTKVSVSLQNNHQLDPDSERKVWKNNTSTSQKKYPLSQGKANELVSTGFQEVLDVFLPVDTQTGWSQILDPSLNACCYNYVSKQATNRRIFKASKQTPTQTNTSFLKISSVTLSAAALCAVGSEAATDQACVLQTWT